MSEEEIDWKTRYEQLAAACGVVDRSGVFDAVAWDMALDDMSDEEREAFGEAWGAAV